MTNTSPTLSAWAPPHLVLVLLKKHPELEGILNKLAGQNQPESQMSQMKSLQEEKPC